MKWTETDAMDWRRLYEDGATIEEIYLDTGASHAVVRRLIVQVGGQMRPQGQRPGTVKRNVTTMIDGIRGAVVVPIKSPPIRAHRRRGNRGDIRSRA